ncbi:MAG: DUF488 domain-containing protein [Duncaniella sp.]|nr:DUF488 domain-containing protein [Duncaniella sp.]
MQPSFLYSIGHGQKSFEELIQELLSFNINYLVDVRSNPFSKWATQFNRGIIENLLKPTSIRYAYMGDVIGGRPIDDSCYDEEGFFDYHKMALMPRFVQGLHRLIDANSKHLTVAVMCSESNPAECHRSKLIGRELFFGAEIAMTHIIAPGKSRSQIEIMTELDRGKGNWPDGDLFGSPIPPYFKSRKSYKKEEQIDINSLNYYD